MSTLCLGTMTFGSESEEQVAREQLDRFLDQGGNFVDTADVYSDGEVEVIDLYQAHAWDPLTPIEETLWLFDDAVRAGKIQYVGVSNSSAGSCRRRRC